LKNFPDGGCWIIKIAKNNGLIDRIWEELLFAVIAEKFLDLDMVGIMVSIRAREDKISIWNRGSKVLNNGERLRKILNLDPETHLQYQSFSHALEVGATYRDAISFVYKPFFYKSNKPSPTKVEKEGGKKEPKDGPKDGENKREGKAKKEEGENSKKDGNSKGSKEEVAVVG